MPSINCCPGSVTSFINFLLQHSQLRVYRAPFWTLERTIPHPHRQFQHLTPVRGTWHPLVDMIVAGRYPDPKFPGTIPDELRTIDFFDADTGSTEFQLHEPGLNMISSLNQVDNLLELH